MRAPHRRAWQWGALCLLVIGGCKEHSRATSVASPTRATPISRQEAVTTAGFVVTAPSNDTAAGGSSVTGDRATDRAASSTLSYERLTLGGAAADAELPWIVAFHGLGDKPRGFARLFDGLPLRAHVYLAQAPISYGSGYDWFGERVTGDPERLALAIQRRVQDAASLLDALAAQPQNRGDAVVTGFSQGGVLSFAVAVAHLPHVRAALPLAGWLPPSLAASGPTIPVYAFHGEDDHVVPFAASKRMIHSWQQPGRVVEYRTYPDVAHTVSINMRREWAARLEELMR